MTVSQYNHVVPYTDLGGRGYFGVNAALVGDSWQPISDWSAISRQLKTVLGLFATAATGRRSVTNQSVTSRPPVSNHQKPFYDRFGHKEVSLVATKTSLQSNRPCILLQPVGDQSLTSLQPPCNLPVTTRNFGRKEVADRLQAMCDWGLRLVFIYIKICMVMVFKKVFLAATKQL